MRTATRFLWLAALGFLLAAILVGRADPDTTPVRSRCPAPDAIIDCRLGDEFGPYLLDRESGRLRRLDRPRGMVLSRAAISPWQDDWGRRQVVGLAYTVSGTEREARARDFRLVRLSHPDGAVLDSVSLDDGPKIAISPPCWVPGTLTRVLFSGGDGLVYLLDFERRGADGVVERVPDARPIPLAWGVDPPGSGPVTLEGPAWPDDPRLCGRVLVELQRGRPDEGGLTPPHLWWLQVDPAGSTIVAAGRLTRPDPDGDPYAYEERFPVAFVGPDGAPLLAYLDRPRGTNGDYALRIAPLHFDPRTGEPHAAVRESRVLIDGCNQTTPVASSDGRYLAVRIQAQGEAIVRRLPVICPAAGDGT